MAKFCTECGTQIEETKRFCPNCGAVAPQIEQSQQHTQYQPLPRYQPPQYQPAPVKKKNGIAILAIILVAVLVLVGVGGFFVYKYITRDNVSVSTKDKDKGDKDEKDKNPDDTKDENKNDVTDGKKDDNQASNSKTVNIKNASGETAGYFKGAIEAIDEDIENGSIENIAWPSSSLPEWFPVYPDGVIVFAESFFDNDLMLFIMETSKATYDSYLNTLKSNGWIFDEPEDGFESAVKSSWMLLLVYDEEYGTGIYITDVGYDLEELYKTPEWPTNMPVPIPVYTDGKLSYAGADDEDNFYTIMVSDTSKAAVEKYKNDCVGLGWVFNEESGDYSMEADKGTWYLAMSFDDDNNSVFIGLYIMEKFDPNAEVESYEFTGWGEDNFSKQIPEPDFELLVASYTDHVFTAVFHDVTVDMIKKYAEKVIAAGFTEEGEVTEETDKTYSYDAYDGNGFHLNLRLFDGGTMYITLSK